MAEAGHQMAVLDQARLLARYARWTPGLALSAAGRRNVADLVEYQARRRPNATFIWFEGGEQTYAEFNAAANRVANWGRRAGLERGDVVVLLMQNRPEYLQIWNGLAKLGVTTALINNQLEGEGLAHVVREAEARLVVLGQECLENWASLGGEAPEVEVMVLADPAGPSVPAAPETFTDLDAELRTSSAQNPPSSLRADVGASDPLFYIYTSGTTGLPKAAKFSHLRFMGGGMLSHLSGFTAADTIYCALPLYHTVGGVLSVNTALRAGGTLALARHFSASRFWDDVVASGATSFQYIGEFCRYLLAQPERPSEKQHHVRFAVGNGLRPDIWESFQQRFAIDHISEFYGATEGNVVMYNLDNEVGSIGKAAPGLKVALVRYDVDADDHPRRDGRCIVCDPGEAGEALGKIGGPGPAGNFEGYTSKEASEKKIMRDVFEEGDAWFRTGDLLKVDERGYYYFVDRIGDTFRWKGENVATQEVAEAISTFSGVELAAVFGVKVPGADGKAGMAGVVLEEGCEDIDLAGLYAHLEQSLPAYARPAFIRIQAEADLTGTFKLRKVELQKQGYDPEGMDDPLFVRDDDAETYVELTAEQLAAVRAGEHRL
jgi:fatty-acyl-CoA synthase